MFESPYSSNVILAKARAMYGNSLKKKEYTDLLNCHSVSEVASYLKSNTAYASVLSEVNEGTIHRGHLEQLLHRKLFDDIASLGRYDLHAHHTISRYLMMRAEIEQIVSCLRLMSSGRTSEFFFSMPMFFMTHTQLDLKKMSQCKTYDELLATMGHTEYVELLKKFPPHEDGLIRLTEIETALYTKLAKTAYDIATHARRSVRQELRNLFGALYDTQNVTRIVRLKKFFNASPDVIRANLLPYGDTIAQSTIENMIKSSSAEEVMQIFFNTSVGRRIPESQRELVHDIDDRAPYYNARKHIHYSIHPSVVLLSYIILSDVELDDIINIIEGVRYGLEPDQIKPMLVLANS